MVVGCGVEGWVYDDVIINFVFEFCGYLCFVFECDVCFDDFDV